MILCIYFTYCTLFIFISIFISILFFFIYVFIYLFCYLFISLFVGPWMFECECRELQYCILNGYECGRVLHLYFLYIRITHRRACSSGDFLYLTNYLWYPGGDEWDNCDDIPPRPANRGGIIIVICPGWGACPPAFSCNAHAGGAFVPRNEII